MHWPITSDLSNPQNNGNDPRFASVEYQTSDNMPGGICGSPPSSSDTTFQTWLIPWANLLPTSPTADPAELGAYVALGDPVADSTGTTFIYDHTFDDAVLGGNVHAYIKIEPVAINQPPVVSAGGSVEGHSGQPLTLHGSATDDGLPNPPGELTSNWSVISAPNGGSVAFADTSAPTTTATFSRPGHYVLELTASDSDLSASATTTADITDTFTVTGSISVQPSGSQDTHEQTPNDKCNQARLRAYEGLGETTVTLFNSIGAPASAELLSNFLAGTGSEVDFPAGSQISNEVQDSSEFQNLNTAVQAAIVNQLKAGNLQIQLSAPPLATIVLGFTRDLYYGFRGTQGLEVTGSGNVTDKNYIGSLTYVIEDSYGFAPHDTLLGVGTAMRYLQTVCGNPPTSGGAHWFPDTITVTVPFNYSIG